MDNLKRLQIITKKLRDPINGCEWDRVQTFESLKPYTLEETYEVLDAIDQKNVDEIKNELGDLLFQIVFYSDLAEEQRCFNFDDVCQSIADKLISRHPHIFSDGISKKNNWEELKQKERDQKAQYSLLDDIPNVLPALMKAEKIQKRCASIGFDWLSVDLVLDKVKEELVEVEQELNQQEKDPQKIEEEIGDLFFAIVNLARHLKIKSEFCLQRANQKFVRRFKQVELLLQKENGSLNDATVEEMNAAWQAIKQREQA